MTDVLRLRFLPFNWGVGPETLCLEELGLLWIKVEIGRLPNHRVLERDEGHLAASLLEVPH